MSDTDATPVRIEHLLHVMKDGNCIFGWYGNDTTYIHCERRVDYSMLKAYNPMLGIDERLDKDEQIHTDRYCSVCIVAGEDSCDILEGSLTGYTQSEESLLLNYVYRRLDEYKEKLRAFSYADEVYTCYGLPGIMFETQKQSIIRTMIRYAEVGSLDDNNVFRHYNDLLRDRNQIHNLSLSLNMTERQIVTVINRIIQEIYYVRKQSESNPESNIGT